MLSGKENYNSVIGYIIEWLQRLNINVKFKPSFTIVDRNKTSSIIKTSEYVPVVNIKFAIVAPTKLYHYNKRLLSSR